MDDGLAGGVSGVNLFPESDIGPDGWIEGEVVAACRCVCRPQIGGAAQKRNKAEGRDEEKCRNPGSAAGLDADKNF